MHLLEPEVVWQKMAAKTSRLIAAADPIGTNTEVIEQTLSESLGLA